MPQTSAWTLIQTKDAKRQQVCIFVRGIVVRVFSIASRVVSYLFSASYACCTFCTFDFMNAPGPTFRYFSRSARYACSVDKGGRVAVAVSSECAVRPQADEDGSGTDAFELMVPLLRVRPLQVPAPHVPTDAHESATYAPAVCRLVATTATSPTTATTNAARIDEPLPLPRAVGLHDKPET